MVLDRPNKVTFQIRHGGRALVKNLALSTQTLVFKEFTTPACLLGKLWT